MKKHFFTFSELLLISGVAAVVVTLATAAANSLATAPKVAACANIMRGVEKKLTAYENDNDGKIIPTIMSSKRWGRILVDGGYFDDTGFYGDGTRKIYPRKFECPAETRQRSNGVVNISHPSVNVVRSYDYGLNWYVHRPVKGTENNLIKRANIDRANRLMRMTEGTMYRFSNDPADATARHGKMMASNVLFADGHIEFRDPVPFKGTPKYNGAFWFIKIKGNK